MCSQWVTESKTEKNKHFLGLNCISYVACLQRKDNNEFNNNCLAVVFKPLTWKNPPLSKEDLKPCCYFSCFFHCHQYKPPVRIFPHWICSTNTQVRIALPSCFSKSHGDILGAILSLTVLCYFLKRSSCFIKQYLNTSWWNRWEAWLFKCKIKKTTTLKRGQEKS